MTSIAVFRRLALLGLAGLVSCRSGPAASAGPADLVVYGRVWTGDSARPDPQLGRYRKVVYTYHPAVETDSAARAQLEERLRVRLDGFECPFEYRFWDTTQPTPALTDVIVARGCRRAR